MGHKILKIKKPGLFNEVVEILSQENHPYTVVLKKTFLPAYHKDPKSVTGTKKTKEIENFELSISYKNESHKQKELADKKDISLIDALKALEDAANSMDAGLPVASSIAKYFSAAIRDTIEITNSELDLQNGVTTQEITKISAQTLAAGLGILSGNKRPITTDLEYKQYLEAELQLILENHELLQRFEWGNLIDWKKIEDDDFCFDDLSEFEVDEYLRKTNEFSKLQNKLSKDRKVILQARKEASKNLNLQPRSELRYWKKYLENEKKRPNSMIDQLFWELKNSQ